MEPHLFRWGNPAHAEPVTTIAAPQWSPTYSGGETPGPTHRRRPHTRLNGAPPIQVGKLVLGEHLLVQLGASMEPHLFRWGNARSRVCSSTRSSGLNGAPPIQVGKHEFSFISLSYDDRLNGAPPIQVGKRAQHSGEVPEYMRASMEPHLFRWGNGACRVHRRVGAGCLNGAPPIQVGKPCSTTAVSYTSFCLNGAPPIQVGKHPEVYIITAGETLPQWSPTYSGGETGPWQRR